MRRSISNLAWGGPPSPWLTAALVDAGLQGMEVAPTAIWPEAPRVGPSQVRDLGRRWRDEGLAVSGVQSLMYGHPEFQVFDRQTWDGTLEHLGGMVRLAGELQASVAVFGSPRNRVRGDLGLGLAHEMCADFLSRLIPALSESNVVLTLEPNAPEYGADYLTRYEEVVDLADLVGSPWVQPQIDTGCLAMVGQSAAAAARHRLPAHVHVSAPQLAPPPGPVQHEQLARELAAIDYEGWVVLEMLPAGGDPLRAAVDSARWLTAAYS